MPRKQTAGTWDGKPNYRWTRMIKGIRWRLLCRGQKSGEEKANTGYLDLPESDWTESRSLKAANEWWENWSPLTPAQLAECHDIADQIAKFDRIMKKAGIPKKEETKELARQILENLDTIEEPIAKGKSVQYWIGKYQAGKLAAKPSPGRYDNLKRSLRKFSDSVGETAPVTDIDWQAWDDFVVAIKSGSLASSTQRDTLSDSREFIRWLERRDIVPAVKNLTETKTHVKLSKIEHFTKDELRKILQDSTGLLHCFLLLFANCGFRQSDVASLTPEMYDGKYITRKRKKAEDTNAPIVSWSLWEETIEAIEQYKEKSGKLLFVRNNGKEWVIEKLNKDDNRGRDDAFYSDLWKPFKEELKLRLSCGDIRGSCANLLKTDSRYTNQLSLQIKYMGQSPSGVALKYYIDPPQEDLDDAIMSLRKTLIEPESVVERKQPKRKNRKGNA